MTGIAELFASFSSPDEFEVAAQLELFGWRRRKACRGYQRTYAAKEKSDPVKLEARRARQRAYWHRRKTRAA